LKTVPSKNRKKKKHPDNKVSRNRRKKKEKIIRAPGSRRTYRLSRKKLSTSHPGKRATVLQVPRVYLKGEQERGEKGKNPHRTIPKEERRTPEEGIN